MTNDAVTEAMKTIVSLAAELMTGEDDGTRMALLGEIKGIASATIMNVSSHAATPFPRGTGEAR